ncbi:MAG: hypothetical protein IKE75_00610 [Bacilli bacterium]|nr:hypothetical protein [Bacilli bacterium]
MKNFLNEHKKACIIGGIILFLILILALVFVIAPPISGDNYGDRLNNEKKYKVSSNVIDEIKSSVGTADGVNKITYHKEGRILNFTISVKEGVVLDTSKKYAEDIIGKLDEKNLTYYDVQVFLDGKDDVYPIIGYHAKGSEGFSWGNVGAK